MKKEKQVKSYQRRTKSGKTVTVRAHTAKYEAADKAKEAAKKKGAGGELEAKKVRVREMPNPSLPMNEYLDELKKRQQAVKEEVFASEKETKKTPRKSAKKSEKETTKKKLTRPVGSGTNGPTRKEPKGKKYTVNGKDFYVWRTSGTAFSVVDADGKKAKASDRKAVMDMASDKTKKSVERQVAKNKKDRTRTKMESLGYAKSTEKYRESSGVPRTRKTSAKSSEPSFTAAEFKEWYRGTGSAADKKVAKALRAQLGRTGYRKLEDEAIDSYSSRGHLKLFKQISSEQQSKEKGTKQVAGKMGAKKSDKVIKGTNKSTHPKNLTNEQLRDMMRKSGNYAFKKNGEIWYKSGGKQMWKTSVESYRKNLIDEHNEKSAGENLKKYAKEYGFSVKDAPMLAMWGSKPKRKMSEVSGKAVKNYARFEDISTRQAKLELMMMSKKEHDKWDTYKEPKGVSPKRVVKSDDKPYGFSYVDKNGKYVTKYFKTKAAMNSFKKRSKDVVTPVAYMNNSGRTLSDVSREEMISHIRETKGYNNKQAQSFVDNLSTPGYLNLAREISKKETSSKRR